MQKSGISCTIDLVYKTLNHKNFSFVMRMSLIVFAGVLLSFNIMIASPGYSQGDENKIVRLNHSNVSFEDVFKSIEEQAHVVFSYEYNYLRKKGKVSINERNITVAKALDLLLGTNGLTWEIRENIITVKENKASDTTVIQGVDFKSTLISPPLAAPPVSGIVRGSDGEPLAGINIIIKGSKKGIVTDVNGAFTIEATSNDILVISSIGYRPQEMMVGNTTNFLIRLERSASPLDEVQIIAYGQTTKRLNTGNTTTIKAEEIQRQPVNNILLAIQGRVPGLQLSPVNNSLPGSVPRVTIRGVNSIGAGTSPLYILDGVPIAESQASLTGTLSGLMMINPADVESIDVLKDAEATAIYGSRGANGVILITTKKGKPGKARLSIDANTGFSKLARKIQFMDVHQYLDMRREALNNTNITPTEFNAPDLLLWDSSKVNDWQDVFLGKTAVTSDINTSVSGGSAATRYFVNAGYHRDETVYPGNTGNTRKSIRFSIDHTDPGDRFSVSATAAYSNNSIDLLATDLTGFITIAPHYPLYTSDGMPNWGGPSGFPLSYLLQTYYSNTNNYNGNVNLRYGIFKGLHVKLNSSIVTVATDQSLKTPAAAQDPAFNPSGSAYIRNNDLTTWVTEPQVEYKVQVDQHSLTLLGGGMFQKTKVVDVSLSASGFTNDALLNNINAGQNINVNNSTISTNYASFFSRLSYAYNQQYLVNLSFRRDGSSKFGPGKRFGNFGSASAAWIFSQDKNLQRLFPFLSFGKLRSSYGINGNDQIGDFGYITTYGSGLPYQLPTIAPRGLANPDYRWEENRKFEAAIELGFLRDRILFNASWFRNRTSNQLIFYTLPPQTGSGGYTANFPALLQNKGWEFELRSRNIAKANFSWESALQLSVSENRLLKFPGIENTSYNSQYVVGRALSIRQAYRFVGLTDTGVPNLEDADKNGTIGANDRYVVGDNNPFFGGLLNDLRFKNLQLSFFVEYNRINGFDNAISASRVGALGVNATTRVLDRWQAPGDELHTNTPKYTTSAATYNARFFSQSNLFWGTTHIFRIRNASLNYQIPKKFFSGVGITEARLYVHAQNLWVFDKNKYRLDPETGNGGMPPLRIITFGINCTL